MDLRSLAVIGKLGKIQKGEPGRSGGKRRWTKTT